MATNTYVALATHTIPTATSSYTFTSIPQGYTDLILVVSVPSSQNSGSSIQFNSDTDYSNNYSRTVLSGNGTSASSFRNSGASNPAANRDLGALRPNGNLIVQIMNYSNTTTYKTIISRGGGAANDVNAVVTLWKGTAAISSFIFGADAGNLAAGMTLSLYGIASEEASAKATGGMVISDSTYWYHTFTSTGAFVPKQSLTADVLVIAGGGGGGRDQGGGGGAGGLLAFTSQSLSATSYTCTVGAGGAGSTGSQGVDGVDSQFGALTLVKGGGGGGQFTYSNNGRTGGSGGGGGFSGGAATSGQGNAGGNYGSSGGGGGGGKGAVGGNADPNPGSGGAGVNTYSSWASATATGASGFYAGGGGGGRENTGGPGGTGGSGGGGNGAGSGAATAGTTNTGGGGGGGLVSSSVGLAGGSGIVIVRYVK
jgi:hypothetical protein